MSDQYFKQMQDIDYEYMNTIIILNTLALLLIMYFIKVGFYMILKGYLFITKNKLGGKKLARYLKKQLIFNEILNIYIQGYIEFFIGSILTIKFGRYTVIGEQMSFAIAIFSLAFANVFLPIFSAWIVCRPAKTLKRKSFHQKWGILYGDLN